MVEQRPTTLQCIGVHRDPPFLSALRAAIAAPRARGGAPLGGGSSSEHDKQTETWNIFIASDSPAIKVPGARASRYRVYGVIGLHLGNYPNYPEEKKEDYCCPATASCCANWPCTKPRRQRRSLCPDYYPSTASPFPLHSESFARPHCSTIVSAPLDAPNQRELSCLV